MQKPPSPETHNVPVRPSAGGQSRAGHAGLPDPAHVALCVASLAGGGMERVTINLARAFAAQGHQVDLVLCKATGPYRDQVPSTVNVVTLQAASGWLARIKAITADPQGLRAQLLPVLLPKKTISNLQYLSSLVHYLERARPTVLLSADTPLNLVAVWARRLAGVPTRIAISERNQLSQTLNLQHRNRHWRWRFLPPLVGHVYPQADAIVAVSHGVADDLAQCAQIPRERITTVYNPVVDSELLNKAGAPLEHAWFTRASPPVVLGVGRLHEQKDFPTLLRAFARVRAGRDARLMILGAGRNARENAERRAELTALASRLGIIDDMLLPGFVNNPFAYMARASVFVLSSAWEGLPGVLIQALACGCPVVSTDCPSGPAEILAGGAYGPLVPVGDDAALAKAIVSVLDKPPDPERLRMRAAMFSVDRAVDRYLEVLLGSC